MGHRATPGEGHTALVKRRLTCRRRRGVPRQDLQPVLLVGPRAARREYRYARSNVVLERQREDRLGRADGRVMTAAQRQQRRAAPRTPALVRHAVCLTMKPVGEPDAGDRHVRFGRLLSLVASRRNQLLNGRSTSILIAALEQPRRGCPCRPRRRGAVARGPSRDRSAGRQQTCERNEKRPVRGATRRIPPIIRHLRTPFRTLHPDGVSPICSSAARPRRPCGLASVSMISKWL
jgi:hypothetical protein